MGKLHSLLYRAFNGQRNRLRPYLGTLGLGPGQPRVLKYLAEHGESNQKDIAECYSIDPANVSRMVEALLRNGFITQAQCPENRRANNIAITEKGEEALSAWNGYCAEVESVMLEGFTEEEAELLCSFFTRIDDNFRRQP